MKISKILGLVGVVGAVSLALTACGGSNDKKSASKSSSSNEITIMAPFIETDPPAAGNTLLKKIEKYTGSKMNITWVPNASYDDKMNITLASDNLPEIMVTSKTAGFIKSAKSGAFWDLKKYLKDYPNLKQANDTIVENSSVNGKVYGIYRSRDVMRSAVIIRKDWLKKLGLKMPTNTEELYKVAKAFTEQDPDGNGKKDTVGLVVPKWTAINNNGPYDMISLWFGAGNTWDVSKSNKLTASFKSSEYLDSLKYMRKIVKNGYINADYATLATDKWNDPFINSKAGIILDTYSRGASITALFKKSNTDNYQDYVEISGNLEGADGEVRALPTDGYSGFLAIPKASVKTEKELRKVLSFIDKTNDKEAQILMNNGIEGENYTEENGFSVPKETLTTSEQAIATAAKSYAQLGTNVTTKSYILPGKPASAYELKQYNKRLKLMASDTKHAIYNPGAPYVSDTYAEKGTQLDTIISDARIKFYAGQIDEQGWKDAIKLWNKSGGSQMEKEMTTLYQKDH